MRILKMHGLAGSGENIGVLFSVHPKTRKAFGIEQSQGVLLSTSVHLWQQAKMSLASKIRQNSWHAF